MNDPAGGGRGTLIIYPRLRSPSLDLWRGRELDATGLSEERWWGGGVGEIRV